MKNIGNYIIEVLLWLIALLPMRALYLLSDLLYYFIYYVLRHRKKYVIENLRNSFPEKSDNELAEIARKFYRHFCDLAVEILKLGNISKQELSKRMIFPDIGLLQEFYKKKKNVIIVTGHYNNWEWLLGYPFVLPYKCLVVYMPLSYKYFDVWMNRLRTRFGVILTSIDDSYKNILKFNLKNELFITGLIADQSPPPKSNWWTTFMNQETSFFTGAEKIAKKLDMPVVYQKVVKIKRGYYKVNYEVITDDPKNTKPHEITEAFVRLLERDIMQQPEYWLWSHRRWKHKKLIIDN